MRLPAWLRSTSLRLLLFNTLLLFLPLGAFLTLDVFESHMLRLHEETMISQGRMCAAALGGLPGERLPPAARGLLARLESRSQSRVRILDSVSRVVADTAAPVSPTLPQATPATSDRNYQPPESGPKGEQTPFQAFLYDLGSLPFRIGRNLLGAPELPSKVEDDSASLPRNPAVLKALSGRYGAHTTISSRQRSVTLYSAFPVLSDEGAITGAVLVSRSTYRMLRDLYSIRLDIFKIFLASILIAALLGLLASRSISRPLRLLQRQAEQFMERRQQGISFQHLKGNREIEELSAALQGLERNVGDHLAFIESFAADLAHEARNPLSAILCAAEILDKPDCRDGQRQELSRIILMEGRRLETILEASRELSRIDVAAARAERQTLEPAELLRELCRKRELRGQKVVMTGNEETEDLRVYGNRDYLEQALDKLVDNALDFSPPDQAVEIRLSRQDRLVCMDVCDQGKGISPGQETLIFERFSSGRLDGRGVHMGLGLAIARSIARSHGGELSLLAGRDQPAGITGAAFRLAVPASAPD